MYVRDVVPARASPNCASSSRTGRSPRVEVLDEVRKSPVWTPAVMFYGPIDRQRAAGRCRSGPIGPPAVRGGMEPHKGSHVPTRGR